MIAKHRRKRGGWGLQLTHKSILNLLYDSYTSTHEQSWMVPLAVLLITTWWNLFYVEVSSSPARFGNVSSVMSILCRGKSRVSETCSKREQWHHSRSNVQEEWTLVNGFADIGKVSKKPTYRGCDWLLGGLGFWLSEYSRCKWSVYWLQRKFFKVYTIDQTFSIQKRSTLE